MRPLQLLNYPGSKARLMPEILQRLDHEKDVFIEPFLGGGSVLLNATGFNHYWAGDILPYVIYAFLDILGRQLAFEEFKACLDRLISASLTGLPHSTLSNIRKGTPTKAGHKARLKDFYYKFRAHWNKMRVDDHGSYIVNAGFLFLAGACVNNLIRFNKNGDFNQGWGARIFDINRLDLVRAALSQRYLTLRVGSFSQLLDDTYHLWPRAMVYLDPPYGGRCEAGANGLYGLDTGWKEEDDVKLAGYCHRINAVGGKFLLSNIKENKRLTALMTAFKTEELPGVAYKSSVGKHARRQQTEIMISN